MVPTAVEALQPDLSINQVLHEDLKLKADIFRKDQVEEVVRSILVEGDPQINRADMAVPIILPKLERAEYLQSKTGTF